MAVIVGIILGFIIGATLYSGSVDNATMEFSQSDINSLARQLNDIAEKGEEKQGGEYEVIVTYRAFNFKGSGEREPGVVRIPLTITPTEAQ